MVVCLSIVAVIRFYYQQEENISSKETKPVDIGGIRSFCREQKIRWKAHALERMIMRGIAKADVLYCINCGKIIEDYPEARAFPSCLIFGVDLENRVLHVVAGIADDMVHIITVYYPDEEHFESDLITRKKR